MLTRELNAEIIAAKTSFEIVKMQPLDMFRVYVTRYMLTRSVFASNSALGYTDITEQITEIPSGTSRSAIFLNRARLTAVLKARLATLVFQQRIVIANAVVLVVY